MGNLDVSSLFINIYFKETIDICTNTLFEKLKEQRFYQKQNLRNFYFLLQKNSVLFFNGKLYKQADGVTLGSILGLKTTNAFLVYFQIIHLTSSLIITDGMLMIYLFCLSYIF